MLAKHIIGYIPSLAIPAAASFGAVYCYTRLMAPVDYGHYALSFSTMTLLNAVFFYWLQISLPRQLPQAIRNGKEAELKATSYIAFALCALLLVVATLVFTGLAPESSWSKIAWLAVPLACMRSLLNMNQAIHRSKLDFKRYNIIECGQSLLGLGSGLALVAFLGWGSAGAILGMVFGMLVMALVDIRTLLAISVRHFNRQLFIETLRYGLPFVAACGFTFILSTSDRFLIQYFRGAGEVGIYAAGYSLMDRIAQILFMVVATPAFPLVIHRLEHEGMEAARNQTYRNGVAMLALCLPACAGLILCSKPLATVLIGEEFRAGALLVMPWIALGTVLSGLSMHYFDHAFHLAKKPHLLFLTQGPAAAANVLLNWWWIPEYGYLGAAYATVLSYILLLSLSITVGRRVFKIRFPFLPACQIAVSTLLMSLALLAFDFPENLLGLILMAALGGAVYGASLLLFNVMDVRTAIRQKLRRR